MLTLLATLLTFGAHADTFSAEAMVQATPAGRIAPGIGARLEGGGMFLAGEARGYDATHWLGRATAGVDLFGSDRFDLTLGGFAGTAATFYEAGLATAELDPTWGFELGLGTRVGPVHARYRRLDGFRGPLQAHLSENELRLGCTVLDSVEVFGQYVTFNPGEADRVRGMGLGASVTF